MGKDLVRKRTSGQMTGGKDLAERIGGEKISGDKTSGEKTDYRNLCLQLPRPFIIKSTNSVPT